MLRVKLNTDERKHAETLAAEKGLNVSAYVRMLVQEKYSARSRRRSSRRAA